MTHSISNYIRNASFTLMLAVSSLVHTPGLLAQNRAIRVNVPFSFHNGSKLMPAGSYEITPQSEHFLLLRGKSASSFLMTNPESQNSAASKSVVVFHRYGDQYFLTRVSMLGTSTSYKCLKSKREQELEIAQKTPVISNLQVALIAKP